MSHESDIVDDGVPERDGLAREMKIVREIMDDSWEVLRALALSDTYPELDVETLLEMAREQKKERTTFTS